MARTRKLSVSRKELEDNKKYSDYHGYYKVTSSGIRIAFFKSSYIVYLTLNRNYEVVSRYLHKKENLKAVHNLNIGWNEQNYGKLWYLCERVWAKSKTNPMSTYMTYLEKNCTYKAIHKVNSDFYKETLVRMKPMLNNEPYIIEALKESINKTNC